MFHSNLPIVSHMATKLSSEMDNQALQGDAHVRERVPPIAGVGPHAAATSPLHDVCVPAENVVGPGNGRADPEPKKEVVDSASHATQTRQSAPKERVIDLSVEDVKKLLTAKQVCPCYKVSYAQG